MKELKVKVGDKVSEGSVILLLESGAAEPAAAPAAAPKTAVSAPPSPTSAPGGVAEVRVPDIGDFKDVPVIEVLVKAGDTVKAEDALITLESDKATMDVPAPFGGHGAGRQGQGWRQGVRRRAGADAGDWRRGPGGRDSTRLSAAARHAAAPAPAATSSRTCAARRRSTRSRSLSPTPGPACASSRANSASTSVA